MSKIPVLNGIRIIPRDPGFLDRKVGQRGEIYLDRDSDTLRIYDGQNQGGISLAKDDLSNVLNSVFLAKAQSAGVTSSGGENFSLSLAGDDSTVREISSGNVIKFSGDNGITTSVDANGIVTISGTPPNIPVATESVLGGVKIDGTTITITDGIISSVAPTSLSNMTGIQFSIGVPILEFSSDGTLSDDSDSSVPTERAVKTYVDTAVSAIPIFFSSLTDASDAGLTIDEIYLQAITRLIVTNSGASAYLFDQYTGNNPTIYAINGTTIAFKLNATGHPFLIQNGAGNNYSTGLIHISEAGVVSTGASAQGKDSGTLYWKIPDSISGGYRYQCSVHGSMVGSISIKNFGSI